MERLTLGFDTSAAHCAAVLLSGGSVLARAEEAMTRGQAERLLPMLEEVLAEGGARWRDLEVIGVGTGPGNFTGIRVAVAAARGLALSLRRPAEGVSLTESHAAGRDVIACLPAPRGAVVLGRGAALHRLDAEEIDAPERWPAGWDAPLTGPAAAGIAAATGRAVAAPADWLVELGRIAARRAAPGRPRPVPLYLRPADAAPPADAPPAIL